MESGEKRNAFTCKACHSGNKLNTTGQYRTSARKRIVSVGETDNEGEDGISRKKLKKTSPEFVCRHCTAKLSCAGNLKRHLQRVHKTDF